MKAMMMQVAVAAAVSGIGLSLYDHVVARPARKLAVVDVRAIYGTRMAALSARMIASGNEEERKKIEQEARRFAERLPGAMEELAHECRCLVLDKTMLVGVRPDAVDLTAQLQKKVP